MSFSGVALLHLSNEIHASLLQDSKEGIFYVLINMHIRSESLTLLDGATAQGFLTISVPGLVAGPRTRRWYHPGPPCWPMVLYEEDSGGLVLQGKKDRVVEGSSSTDVAD